MDPLTLSLISLAQATLPGFASRIQSRRQLRRVTEAIYQYVAEADQKLPESDGAAKESWVRHRLAGRQDLLDELRAMRSNDIGWLIRTAVASIDPTVDPFAEDAPPVEKAPIVTPGQDLQALLIQAVQALKAQGDTDASKRLEQSLGLQPEEEQEEGESPPAVEE